MQKDEQHAPPEDATDATMPSEAATVLTADGTHVPRYGGMPYGGVPQPAQVDKADVLRADR